MSLLHIVAEESDGRTIITDCRFTSPLKVARPFYHGRMTEMMMMSASAGFLDGDMYDLQINVKERAILRFTGQSFTKIFRAKHQGVLQRVRLSVKSDGCLLYLPPPVIPFGGSAFRSHTDVNLEKGSRFLLCDILSCGRSGMHEQFAWRSYLSRTLVHVEGKPVFLDTQRLVPEQLRPDGIGFFEGFSHIGTAYIYGAEDVQIPECSNMAKTKAAEGICIRMLGNSAEEILSCLKKITISGGNSSWLVF